MIDIQGLLKVLHAAEQEPNLEMGSWLNTDHACGTSHCMIGAFCCKYNDALSLSLLNGEPKLWWNILASPTQAIALRFNITEYEADWLFVSNPLADYLLDAPRVGQPTYRVTKDAIDLSKKEALARLRKFIYYKLHKQEMIVEEPQRNKPITLPRKIAGRSSAILAQYA